MSLFILGVVILGAVIGFTVGAIAAAVLIRGVDR